MAHTSELSWQLDGITMYGTFTSPEVDGPFPAVVMVAGSGPTDRNWNSPLLPGDNGSARLLAEALAQAGMASLRYDKRASGQHVAENLPAMSGHISMQSHLDELVAAVGVLAAREGVDTTRIAGLGNSEGCLHVLHYATRPQAIPWAGLVLTAPPGRAVGEVLLTQLTQQLRTLPDGEALLEMVEAATTRYAQGRPMDPDPRLPENVRMVLTSFETPANLPFARELWTEGADQSLADVRLPTLVVIGRKDAQVDADLDGRPLQDAAAGMDHVTFAFPANANHVLKAEERSVAEVVASRDLRYNDPGSRLDPEATDLITSWLRDVLS
ncbi:MAG: alpha/beta hydrolase [Propionibacteriaceae bacterium]|nr:alpha/beta hydrolase [Propionibacteriaceae bacterium]